MFHRFITLLALVCFSVITAGCSALLTKQEWSENYALLEGAHSTSPQMIDGELESIGQTSFPRGAKRGSIATPPSEVVITLPEEKIVRKIVIHSDNVKKLEIFADKGIGTIDADWKLIKEIKSVTTNPIEIPVSILFPTAKLRVRVLETTEDSELTRKKHADDVNKVMRAQRGGKNSGAGLSTLRRRAAGKIREIEIYGYKSADSR